MPKKGYTRLRSIGTRLRKRLSKGKDRLKKPAGSLFKLRVQLENPAEAAGQAGEAVEGAVPDGVAPRKEEEAAAKTGWFGRKKG